MSHYVLLCPIKVLLCLIMSYYVLICPNSTVYIPSEVHPGSQMLRQRHSAEYCLVHPFLLLQCVRHTLLLVNQLKYTLFKTSFNLLHLNKKQNFQSVI